VLGDAGAFAAIGLQGQYIYIDPSRRTVVVKLSYFSPGDNTALDGETQAFLQTDSAWKPQQDFWPARGFIADMIHGVAPPAPHIVS
jgi:CubicO group peptidase (beta-lactamase class C family)